MSVPQDWTQRVHRWLAATEMLARDPAGRDRDRLLARGRALLGTAPSGPHDDGPAEQVVERLRTLGPAAIPDLIGALNLRDVPRLPAGPGVWSAADLVAWHARLSATPGERAERAGAIAWFGAVARVVARTVAGAGVERRLQDGPGGWWDPGRPEFEAEQGQMPLGEALEWAYQKTQGTPVGVALLPHAPLSREDWSTQWRAAVQRTRSEDPTAHGVLSNPSVPLAQLSAQLRAWVEPLTEPRDPARASAAALGYRVPLEFLDPGTGRGVGGEVPAYELGLVLAHQAGLDTRLVRAILGVPIVRASFAAHDTHWSVAAARAVAGLDGSGRGPGLDAPEDQAFALARLARAPDYGGLGLGVLAERIWTHPPSSWQAHALVVLVTRAGARQTAELLAAAPRAVRTALVAALGRAATRARSPGSTPR